MSASRGATVAIIAGLGAAVSLSTLPTWVSGTTPTATGDLAVAAAGTAAAPGAASVGLVLLALALVLGLAGRGMRIVGLVGVSLFALAGAANVVSFLSHPEGPATTAAVKLTNVRLVNSPVATAPWPYVCLAALAVAVVVGAVLAIRLARSASWAEVGRRYRRDGAPAETAEAAQTPAPEVAPRRPHLQAMDDWDAISRGEDPTSTRLD